ncbi:hypothetical protein [Paraburkholderia solisilvae]|uniref:Uncharacterized protein n=1 Tax=Paraburkholderia solisilvae TaxID=624376 RepID=A0A6J5E085_9BURK|nr:hypothetical protein [Paraburkholderia solisilvae]CAB3759377.1 hypothetical protein LMG29739_03138 [Paraburkholderia solisilvae]
MSRFYKRREAADLAALELEPNDADRRRAIADNFFGELYDALNDGRVVGRDPENLRQIRPGCLLAAIAFGGALIAAVDVNSWLSASGYAVSLPVDEVTSVPLGHLSDEQILREVEELKNAGGNRKGRHNKQVAEKYGITVSQVKYRCKRATQNAEKQRLKNLRIAIASSAIFPATPANGLSSS